MDCTIYNTVSWFILLFWLQLTYNFSIFLQKMFLKLSSCQTSELSSTVAWTRMFQNCSPQLQGQKKFPIQFLLGLLFEWKSPRSASFLIVRSRSVTNFCLFHDIQHSNTHMMMLITFKPFKDIKILILILYVFFDIQDIFSSKLYFLYWQ